MQYLDETIWDSFFRKANCGEYEKKEPKAPLFKTLTVEEVDALELLTEAQVKALLEQGRREAIAASRVWNKKVSAS